MIIITIQRRSFAYLNGHSIKRIRRELVEFVFFLVFNGSEHNGDFIRSVSLNAHRIYKPTSCVSFIILENIQF